MKKILVALIVVLCFVVPMLVLAAGTVTETQENLVGVNIIKRTITWTADASNADVPDASVAPLNGYLLKVTTHNNGTIESDPYDITLIEHNNGSLDLFDGQGTGRTGNQYFYPSHNNSSLDIYPVFSSEDLTFKHVNGTVNSSSGKVILTIEQPR